MRTFWKVIVGLLLTLPVAAYITGTLVASQAELPRQRAPIVLDNSVVPPAGAPSKDAKTQASDPTTPKDKPDGAEPPRQTEPPAPRVIDDDDDDDGVDDGVEVVRPEPDDFDDDSDGGDDNDGRDDQDDDQDDDRDNDGEDD